MSCSMLRLLSTTCSWMNVSESRRKRINYDTDKGCSERIEQYAPLPLQESFDNAGVQVGDVNQLATGALLCLDVTEEVVDEAIEMGCNLIISHHPLAFKAFKSLTGSTYIERCMIKACKYDLVIYAAHTNLDNAAGGVNFRLAELIGLENVRVLSPQKGALLKLVTFVPEVYAELVRTTLFNAGAGTVGAYDSCSFNLAGKGNFPCRRGVQIRFVVKWESCMWSAKSASKRYYLLFVNRRLHAPAFGPSVRRTCVRFLSFE